jgi:hypothetical protein
MITHMFADVSLDKSHGERYMYTNDGWGNVLARVYENYSGGQWGESYRVTYAYREPDSLTSDVDEQILWPDSSWNKTLRYTITRDASRRIVSGECHSRVNTSWQAADAMMVLGDNEGETFSNSYGGSYSIPSPDLAGNRYVFYGYKFTLTTRSVATGVAPSDASVPLAYSLMQNYPNPFNPQTTIEYELPLATHVSMAVYDVLGREVSVLVNDKKDAGVHRVRFDGSKLASGVYFYRLQAGSFVQSKKLLLLR